LGEEGLARLGLTLGDSFACGVGGVFSIRSRTASRELSGDFGIVNLEHTAYDIPFRAPALKLARARQHLAELRDVIAAYVAAGVAEARTEVGPDGGLRLLGWNVAGPPDVLSPIMGDILHNLRAALDLMACEICGDFNARFPFAKDEKELETMIDKRLFCKAGPEAVQLLREFKPYKEGGNKELRALHDLDIHDKHKALILAPGILASLSVTWEASPDGTEPPKLKSQEGPFELFMPRDSTLAGRPAIQTLEELVELTAGIVEAFKRLFVPAGAAPVRGNFIDPWKVSLCIVFIAHWAVLNGTAPI
jgi:hypothetical protein